MNLSLLKFSITLQKQFLNKCRWPVFLGAGPFINLSEFMEKMWGKVFISQYQILLVKSWLILCLNSSDIYYCKFYPSNIIYFLDFYCHLKHIVLVIFFISLISEFLKKYERGISFVKGFHKFSLNNLLLFNTLENQDAKFEHLVFN